MSNRSMVIVSVLIVALIGATIAMLAGGGAGDKATTNATAAAKAAYCTDADSARTALDSFKSLKLDASLITTLPADIYAFKTSVDRLRVSAAAQFKPEFAAVQSSFDALQKDISSISGPVDIANALTTVPNDAKALVAAANNLLSATQVACRA